MDFTQKNCNDAFLFMIRFNEYLIQRILQNWPYFCAGPFPFILIHFTQSKNISCIRSWRPPPTQKITSESSDITVLMKQKIHHSQHLQFANKHYPLALYPLALYSLALYSLAYVSLALHPLALYSLALHPLAL